MAWLNGCIYACFFLSGATSLVFEVLWSREFVTVFGNSSYAISIVLCAYMAGDVYKRQVTTNTPPTFLLQAEDDPVDNVNHSLVYYIALKNAGVPVEMHLYAQGGHAFGLRRTKFPITEWPRLVETWLGTIGMTSK